MIKPIWQWSAVETAKAVKSREITAVSVVEAHLARLAEVNPAVNAVVVERPADALSVARAADHAQTRGAELGPLHGVPVTVKINVDVKGQRNSNGVVAYKDNIAIDDAPVVSNLKKAGAIVIGMTNTPEFSMRAFTDNPLYGLTLNPWNRDITCGGSSGGAAASVALGIGAIAHGNDIGGSLRWPAYCNGVATIKPTQGRIPAFNPSATEERGLMAQLLSAQGPIARTIADVRLGLEVMAARDVRDPWWVPAPLRGPELARPIKVALAKMPVSVTPDSAVTSHLRFAADALAAAGYEVSEVEIPLVEQLSDLHRSLVLTELSVLQRREMQVSGSADFNQAIDTKLGAAKLLDRDAYMRAIAIRSRYIRAWMAFLEIYPVVLTPLFMHATPGPRADLDAPDRILEIWSRMRFVGMMNVLGLPAATVPVGLCGTDPVGVQLVAARYREDLCLDAAAAIESRFGVLAERLWARDTGQNGQM